MSFNLSSCLTGDCDHFDKTFSRSLVFYTYTDEKMREEIFALAPEERAKFLSMLAESCEVVARGEYPEWKRVVLVLVPLLRPQDRDPVLELLYKVVEWSGCDNEAAEFFCQITSYFPLSKPEKRAMYEKLTYAEVNKEGPNDQFLKLVEEWNKW